MAFKKTGLTPKRQLLVKAYAKTGDPQISSREAGLTIQAGYRALHDPGVLTAIKREQLRVLVTDGVPVAVKALIEIAGNPLYKESARVMASKEILSIAKVSPEAITEEALEGATIAELQALLERTKDHNAKHATIVEAEVIELEEPGALD